MTFKISAVELFFIAPATLDDRDDMSMEDINELKRPYREWAASRDNETLATVSIKDTCEGKVKYAVIFSEFGPDNNMLALTSQALAAFPNGTLEEPSLRY
jgi:hypothetical protein